VAGGLQKQLADGRPLSWLADNQLRQVCLVARTQEGADDTERYHYADGGTRTRKISTVNTEHGVRTTITTYAGGCETRQRLLDGQLQKHIVISAAGDVRWVEDRLNKEGHIRYGFSDHLGSNGGETDQDGKLVCREEYAPFGETTGTDEATVEADNLTQRTWRYSGKERDATGLYYYGWRYYLPALGRWLSADPSGLVDGHNLYRMVRNNPVRYRDGSGLFPIESSGYPSSSDSHESTTTESLSPQRLGAFDATRYLWSTAVGFFWFAIGIYLLARGGYREATKGGANFTLSRFGSVLKRHATTAEGLPNIATIAIGGITSLLGGVSTALSLAGTDESASSNIYTASIALGVIATLIGLVNWGVRSWRDPSTLTALTVSTPHEYNPEFPSNYLSGGLDMTSFRIIDEDRQGEGSPPLSPAISPGSSGQTVQVAAFSSSNMAARKRRSSGATLPESASAIALQVTGVSFPTFRKVSGPGRSSRSLKTKRHKLTKLARQ